MGRYDSNVRFDSAARWDEPDATSTAMSQNLISQVMTDAQRDAMLADLTSFDTKFATYKTTLTPADIARLAKLSAADIALLELALTYAQQNPSALPADVNVAELARDIALAKQVAIVNQRAQQMGNQTHASLIAVMSDGDATARQIYRTAQAQGRTGGNAAFLDAFGARFAKGPKTKTTKPTA